MGSPLSWVGFFRLSNYFHLIRQCNPDNANLVWLPYALLAASSVANTFKVRFGSVPKMP